MTQDNPASLLKLPGSAPLVEDALTRRDPGACWKTCIETNIIFVTVSLPICVTNSIGQMTYFWNKMD